MSFVAFPLRLGGAFLRRCEEPDAIASLVSVMARTPHGSWAGGRHFGLRDFFEEARLRPALPQLAVKELNLALQDLGITNYRVESIARETQTDCDVDSYVLELVPTKGGGQTQSLRLLR